MRLAIGWASTAGDTGAERHDAHATDRMFIELAQGTVVRSADIAGADALDNGAGVAVAGLRGPSDDGGQSAPRRMPRPGVAPVCSPSANDDDAVDDDLLDAVGNRRGSS